MTTLTEITGQTLAQAGLPAGEDRFHAAMQHSGIGMAIVAPDGRWLQVNPTFCSQAVHGRNHARRP